MRIRSSHVSFQPELVPLKKLPDSRRKGLTKAWVRDRANNIEVVRPYVEELFLKGYPEHKQCLIKAIGDDTGLLLWKAFDVLRDNDKALDCTIDALAKACRSLERRPIEVVKEMDLKSWLCQCVYRRALTLWRREARLDIVSLQETMSREGSESIVWYPASKDRVDEQPEQVAIYRDVCELFVNLLMYLPHYQLYAILMHYLAGERWAVVAPRFWTTEKAANMAACRGLKALRAMMEEEGLHLRIGDFQAGSFRGILEEALFELEEAVRDLYEIKEEEADRQAARMPGA